MTTAPFGVSELQIERLRLAPEQLGQQRRRRRELRVAVRLLLHDVGVDAERNVVDEQPAVHRRVVDPTFDRVSKRVHRVPRIVSVQSEVEREVVASSGAHTDEGQSVLDRDCRDECLRTVTTRHAQAVRTPLDGIARELLEIEAVVEEHGLDAQLRGKVDESEALDLSAARPRVAQQHRLTRWTSRSYTDVDVMELVNQSGTRARQ